MWINCFCVIFRPYDIVKAVLYHNNTEPLLLLSFIGKTIYNLFQKSVAAFNKRAIAVLSNKAITVCFKAQRSVSILSTTVNLYKMPGNRYHIGGATDHRPRGIQKVPPLQWNVMCPERDWKLCYVKLTCLFELLP